MKDIQLKFKGVEHVLDAKVDFASEQVEVNGLDYSIEQVPFDVPVSGTMYGLLLNYKDEYAALEGEMNDKPYIAPPQAPVLYIKPENTFIADGEMIPLPDEEEELRVGAALGIVIGRDATRVSKEDAYDYIAGYTVVNDISLPHTNVHRPAVKEKARDGFCPVGPWVMSKEAVANPNDLTITVKVNDEVKQTVQTKNLIRNVETIIADLTDFMTLYAGDVVLVGVDHGAPIVKENDGITIEIEGVGTLYNRVMKESALKEVKR